MSKVKIKVYEGTGTRNLIEKVATADGLGTTGQKIGVEMYGFVVEIDADWLRSMGARAAANVNGKAVRGGVTAKVVNRTKL